MVFQAPAHLCTAMATGSADLCHEITKQLGLVARLEIDGLIKSEMDKIYSLRRH